MLRQSVPRELTLFWGVSKVYNLTNNRLQLKHKSHVFYSISCPISNHRAHLASWYERSWRSWKLYHVLFGMQIRDYTCIRCYISAVPLRKLSEQMVGRGGARQLTWGASCAPLLTKTGYFSTRPGASHSASRRRSLFSSTCHFWSIWPYIRFSPS